MFSLVRVESGTERATLGACSLVFRNGRHLVRRRGNGIDGGMAWRLGSLLQHCVVGIHSLLISCVGTRQKSTGVLHFIWMGTRLVGLTAGDRGGLIRAVILEAGSR